MSDLDRAKNTLKRLFHVLMVRSGLSWNEDLDAEIDAAVDDIAGYVKPVERVEDDTSEAGGHA